ncbi:MAG TPA: branched-chain amino acid ABC transporter permease [Actinomycetota bacterium]|jgi:branched-chain amino acid transport system permease protein|nr:branched-chain amino acid ABC transporter permease [Actinomycetota bacterium]
MDRDEGRATAKTTLGRLGLPERIPVRRTILVILSIAIVIGVAAGSWATLSEGRLPGDAWRSFVVNGVARGSVYALIAMGYTLVYGILFMINFAHGEVFMAGTFTSFFVARAMADAGFLNENPIIGIVILLLVSMAVSTSIAVLLERIAYRPLRGAPRLVPLITAIGASLFLQYTFRGLYGARVRGYPQIDAVSGRMELLGLSIERSELVVILSAVALVIGLYFFIQRTKTGRSMRAVGEDREIASLMGINVDRVIVTTFAIGGMLAGAAGILYVFLFPQVDFLMGFFPGIKAFTAAVLGGIGNVVGAAIGGLILGVLEAVGPTLFLSGAGVPSTHQLQPVMAFGVLVLVLIFRPGGILGSAEEKRA